jgi:hypothetical protein
MELDAQRPRIVPDPVAANPADEEALDVWGFRDTRPQRVAEVAALQLRSFK